MNNNDIKKVEKRTLRYWFEDGLWDMAYGGALLFLGAFYLAGTFFNLAEKFGMFFAIIQMLVVIAAFLGIGRLVKRMKERITYPRTGYVSYRKPKGSQRIKKMLTSFILALVVSFTLASISSLPAMHNKAPVVTGIILGLVTFYLGWRFEINRYYLVSLFTIILGAGLAFFNLGIDYGLSFFFMANGLVWIIAGGIALRNYLHHSDLDPEQISIDNQGLS